MEACCLDAPAARWRRRERIGRKSVVAAVKREGLSINFASTKYDDHIPDELLRKTAVGWRGIAVMYRPLLYR